MLKIPGRYNSPSASISRLLDIAGHLQHNYFFLERTCVHILRDIFVVRRSTLRVTSRWKRFHLRPSTDSHPRLPAPSPYRSQEQEYLDAYTIKAIRKTHIKKHKGEQERKNSRLSRYGTLRSINNQKRSLLTQSLFPWTIQPVLSTGDLSNNGWDRLYRLVLWVPRWLDSWYRWSCF